MKYRYTGLILLVFMFSCKTQKQKPEEIKTPEIRLSPEEAETGIKEALVIASGRTVDSLNKVGSYTTNPALRISFPAEAKKAETVLKELGLVANVAKIEGAMNLAAESSVKEARSVLVLTIKQLKFEYPLRTLIDGNGAATRYLTDSGMTMMRNRYRPVIKANLEKLNFFMLWNDAVNMYQAYPNSQKIKTDITSYVVDESLKGLLKVLETEENKIRNDISKRPTENIVKAFSYADRYKKK